MARSVWEQVRVSVKKGSLLHATAAHSEVCQVCRVTPVCRGGHGVTPSQVSGPRFNGAGTSRVFAFIETLPYPNLFDPMRQRTSSVATEQPPAKLSGGQQQSLEWQPCRALVRGFSGERS